MPTRKTFIAAAAGLAAVTQALASQSAQAQANPTPAPTTSTAPPQPSKPSGLALQLARSLQRGLPKAHLSDAIVLKIASDIRDNFSITIAFRSRRNRALPPPDFVFVAANADRP